MPIHYILRSERKLEPVYIKYGHDSVTITFNNEKTIEWQTIDFKRRRLKPNEITRCSVWT